MPSPRLNTTAPFDGRGLMRYFADHAIPDVEFGDDGQYRRMIRGPDGTVFELQVELQAELQVDPVGGGSGDNSSGVLASLGGRELPASFVPRVNQLFNLDADSHTIDAHLATDPMLTESVAMHSGIRLPGCLDAHEQLLRTMIGQQISIAAARTIAARLSRELDGTGLFPTAGQLAERGLEVLRGPASRVAAIHGVALALDSGALTLAQDQHPEELTERLLSMPGVGPWTAGYVSMRVLGAQDVLLASDLVLLKGAAKLGLPATPRGISDYARRWAPYRSYAGLHLWRAAQRH